MKKYCLIPFDLEATDKNEKEAQIVQIGAMAHITSEECKEIKEDTFCELVKPTIPITKESSVITGITDETVKNAPRFPVVIQQFTDWLDKLDPNVERILLAYNGKRFDIPLLVHELRRNNIEPIVIFRKWKITYFLDAFPLVKIKLDTTKLKLNDRGLPCYKLESVFKCFLHQELTHAHNALYDARGLLRLMLEVPCLKPYLFDFSNVNINESDPMQYLFNLLTLIQTIKINTKKTKQPSTCVLPLPWKKHKCIQEFICQSKTEFETICQSSCSIFREGDYSFLKNQMVLFRFEKESIEKMILETVFSEDQTQLLL